MQNFRCFDALALEFPPEGAVMVGANAQGKTSILEAVCVLTRLQSPRSPRMGKMLKVETPEFGIAGNCWESERQVRYAPRKGLSMMIDDEAVAKQNEYLTGGLIVWMGNDDLDLVRGSGKSRRRYLDFLGCQVDPLYRDHLHRYQRVLKARNLLLKDQSLNNREGELAAYTELLVKHGEYLTKVRRDLVGLLEPESTTAQAAVSSCDERVGMEYLPGSGDDLAESLAMTSERERRTGQTVAGPHRDEVRLTINGMAAADFASEGQQRTLALSLKLAQGCLLENKARRLPVYLLDDIFGELDTDRRNALMEVLPTSAQKLITTTNIDWMDREFAVIPVAR
ncbi:MAG: DNA replication/repair protein RecF [Akkermansiaceae bacterium]